MYQGLYQIPLLAFCKKFTPIISVTLQIKCCRVRRNISKCSNFNICHLLFDFCSKVPTKHVENRTRTIWWYVQRDLNSALAAPRLVQCESRRVEIGCLCEHCSRRIELTRSFTADAVTSDLRYLLFSQLQSQGTRGRNRCQCRVPA